MRRPYCGSRASFGNSPALAWRCRGFPRRGVEDAVEQVGAGALQPVGAATQRLKDRLRARREPTLEHGEREADRVLPLALQPVGEVHPVADVLGDLLVEELLIRGQPVGGSLRDPLREQRTSLEGDQLLLHHAPHQPVGGAGLRVPIAGTGEAVAVKQREEGLEVLLLAVVRRRCHQQEVPGALAQQLAELEPLRRLQLAAEPRRAHPVRLVHDHEVELGLLDLFQQHLVAGELIHACDEQPLLLEHALSRCGVVRAGREDLELQAELQRQLVLPLLHQPSRGHHQTGAHVVPEDQLLDVEPGHDRLARAGVVGQ